MKSLAVKQQARAKQNTASRLVEGVVQSPGQPLDAETLAFFEPRFGHDFSQVRVHRDAAAMESARAIHAVAYAARQHIVLRDGAPPPQSAASRELLAHELAHVVQQSSRPSGLFDVPHGPRLAVRPAQDLFEQQADQMAGRVLTCPPLETGSIRPLMSIASGPLVVQRRPDGRDEPKGINPDDEQSEIELHQALMAQREKERAAEIAETKKNPPEAKLRARILHGEFKDEGAYEYGEGKPFRFRNPELQSVLRYFQVVWTASVPLRAEPPKGSFDSFAKAIAEHPQWSRSSPKGS